MTAFWTRIRSTAGRFDEWTPITSTASMPDPALELARLTVRMA
jgi:hypothetical protein